MFVILVMMGECAVPLSDIESEDCECDGAGDLFHEGTFLLVCDLRGTFLCEQVVLVLIELLFNFSSEHI